MYNILPKGRMNTGSSSAANRKKQYYHAHVNIAQADIQT
jgi:hypothetical protein